MVDSAQLSQYLKNQSFVAFDTETTGMWAPSNRIVELGAVRFTLGDEETTTFQQLINPGQLIPPEVIAIHGITDQMVAEAPVVGTVLQDFADFCGPDTILIAHNAPFDISFVACELSRNNLAAGKNRIMDTVDIFHRLYPGLPSYSLLSLVEHFGIASSQQHRALEDAIFVMKLIKHASPMLSGIESSDDLANRFTIYSMDDGRPVQVSLPESYAAMQEAADDSRPIQISYRSNNRTNSTRVIRIKEIYRLGTRYYLNAYCERAGADRTFRLDRIEQYDVLADN